MLDRATLSLGTTSVTSNVALQAGSSQQGIARLASVDYKTCIIILCYFTMVVQIHSGGKYTCEFQLVLVQFQYNGLNRKLPFSISWPNSNVNTLSIRLPNNRKPCTENILTIC